MVRIRNWKKFQHFKDRSPPWVKLYRDILDDPDWHDLPAEAAKALVMMWVIASEDETKEGRLPDSKKLAFRLRISEKSLKTIMSQASQWLIQDDISVISEGYQVDAPERAGEETETETETEYIDTSCLVVSKLPTCPQQEILKLYEEILPELPQPRMWDGARATALTARWKAVLKLLVKPDKTVTEAEALDYFRQLFLLVKKSDFLMGNKGEWTASLGWIVKAENFAKIIDGNYDQ